MYIGCVLIIFLCAIFLLGMIIRYRREKILKIKMLEYIYENGPTTRGELINHFCGKNSKNDKDFYDG